MPIVDIDPWYASILTCPDCEETFVRREPEKLWCVTCAIERPLKANANLLPRKPRSRHVEFPLNFDPEPYLSRLDFERPEATYVGPLGLRDGTELLSVLQQSLSSAGRVLDLGCGPKDQATPVTSLGHEYVGVDYANPAADLLADAHQLPFQTASFDFIFSYTVLEHLHNPFLALQEISRVLKPGGIMCGTVSQGEPFHNSFFHHTAWGVISVCAANQFEVIRIWPCWDTLDGLASMGRYSKLIRLGLRCLGAANARMPFLSPRKMRWPEREKALDRLHRAASIGFVIKNRKSAAVNTDA